MARLRVWIEGPEGISAERVLDTFKRRAEREGWTLYKCTPDQEPDTCTSCGAECPEEAHPVIGRWHRPSCVNRIQSDEDGLD